jgi:hypothetical protein
LRIAASCSDDFSLSPASEKVAASIKRFVTPVIAETTTTTEDSRAAAAQIWAVRAMQGASPTEVPPNFITTSLDFNLDRADDADRESAFKGPSEKPPAKNYIPTISVARWRIRPDVFSE